MQPAGTARECRLQRRTIAPRPALQQRRGGRAGCDGSLLLRMLASNPRCYLRPHVSTRKPHLRPLLGCWAPHTAGEPPLSGVQSSHTRVSSHAAISSLPAPATWVLGTEHCRSATRVLQPVMLEKTSWCTRSSCMEQEHGTAQASAAGGCSAGPPQHARHAHRCSPDAWQLAACLHPCAGEMSMLCQKHSSAVV